MEIKERLKLFAQAKNLTIQRLELQWGVCNGYVNSIRKSIGLEKLGQLLKTFPDLNRDWLLYGEGEMLNKIETPSIVAEPTNNYTSNTDVIEVEAEEIANFSLPFANNDIAQSRDIDIRELVESNSPKLERYYVGRKLMGRDKYAQRIITEAMTGANFIPGDVLILSYLNDGSEMHSGYAYLFDTKKYGTLFRQVFIKDDHYELKPCNPNFETLYLKDEDIRSFARLVMQIRTSFSFDQGATLTELVQQRDRHIRKLADSIQDSITAHSQVLNNQAELIAELRKQNDRVDRERERVDKLIDKVL